MPGFDPNTAPLGPSDWAYLAHLTPEQAAGLPPAVLRALATQPSYAEGDIIPVQRDFGEPLSDPASTKALNDWLNTLDAMKAHQDWYGTNLARGGHVGLPRGPLSLIARRRRRQKPKERMRLGALSAILAHV